MPLYKAAETEMIARIQRGDWEIGRRLPNEFQLAEEFGVSQGTMRRALISLEGMGLLNRKPGRGTLVAANSPEAASGSAQTLLPVLTDKSGALLELATFRARQETRQATAAEAEHMNTARVSVLERTLKLNSARAAMDAIAVPEALIDSLDDDAPVELAEFLEHHGISAARLSAEASAEMTDMAQSVALSVDRHTALLVIRLAAYDTSGQVIARQILRVAAPEARLGHR
ncbi:GntR family transcriptional regulator [Gymnodinialimonas mytili]|uniref:GntR family transcriptional regulator n=1 Tax=Gymnodinialimonas mytili TaxID=3126503 RepID=UPI0030ED2735